MALKFEVSITEISEPVWQTPSSDYLTARVAEEHLCQEYYCTPF